MAMHKRIEWIWPPVTDAASAKKASRQGLWACALCVSGSIFIFILKMLGMKLLWDVDMWVLVEVSLLIIIGWGIFKMNRVAAVAGLFLYLSERVFMWVEYGRFTNLAIVITIIISIMFINSIRGVFAYQKYRKETYLTAPV